MTWSDKVIETTLKVYIEAPVFTKRFDSIDIYSLFIYNNILYIKIKNDDILDSSNVAALSKKDIAETYLSKTALVYPVKEITVKY